MLVRANKIWASNKFVEWMKKMSKCRWLWKNIKAKGKRLKLKGKMIYRVSIRVSFQKELERRMRAVFFFTKEKSTHKVKCKRINNVDYCRAILWNFIKIALRAGISNPSNWWSHSMLQLILSFLEVGSPLHFPQGNFPLIKQQMVNKLKRKLLRDSWPVNTMQITCKIIILGIILGSGEKLTWKAQALSFIESERKSPTSFLRRGSHKDRRHDSHKLLVITMAMFS